MRAERQRLVRAARRLGVLTVAAVLTVALAQSATTAAFTAGTADGGNQATSAATFCATTGPQTVAASADTTVYQLNPTTTYGTNAEIGVGSESGANGRVLLRFTLPTPQPHCVMTAATLRLHAHTPAAGRTINVLGVDPAAPAWSEATTHWSNQPATLSGTSVDSASRATAGWQEWTVTSIVTSFYAGTNSGFLLRDSAESSGTAQWQLYGAREYGTASERPELVLTWG